jgi:hypothetical protein
MPLAHNVLKMLIKSEDESNVMAVISALGVLFTVFSVSFGAAVSTLLKIKLTLEERLCLSIVTGHALSTMLVYLFSYWQGRLDFLSIGIGMISIVFASLFIILIGRRDILGARNISKNFNLENVIVILFGSVAFTVLNLKCVLREEFSSIYGSSFVSGDYCFHISVINSFVYRNNFPPTYPVMINTPMVYPPLVDFLSSILMKTGFDLRSSIIIPNVLFQVSLLCLVASLAVRITKRKYVGVLSALLFFFAGNMGIVYAFSDIVSYGFANWVSNLPTDYSGSGISSLPVIRFGNPVTVMLMPQRPSMLGIGISLVVYLLMFHAIQNEENTGELILSGVLTGLLLSIHPHSFIAVAIILFFLTILFRKNLRFFTRFFVPAVVLALPQVLGVMTHVGGGFMGLTIGWLKENVVKIMALNWSTPSNILVSALESVSILVGFWLMNIGFILLPFIFGFLKSDNVVKRFYSPYLILFLLGNFIRFQPWDWDNYKIFLHWHIITVIIGAYGIIEIAKFSSQFLKSDIKLSIFKSRLTAVFGFISLAAILFFSTASGFLSHARTLQEKYLIWPEADIAFASWVRENTPPESVFLTSTYFLNPIVTLAGRQIILGYEGWLWSHGINWNLIQEVKNDVIEMFCGNYTLMKKYGVDYIIITRYEYFFAADNGFMISSEFFNESSLFEKVYDETISGNRYLVLKVL